MRCLEIKSFSCICLVLGASFLCACSLRSEDQDNLQPATALQPTGIPWWWIAAVNVLSSRTAFLHQCGPWRISGSMDTMTRLENNFAALATSQDDATSTLELLYHRGTAFDNTDDYNALASLVKRYCNLLSVPFAVKQTADGGLQISIPQEDLEKKYRSQERKEVVTAILTNFATVIACQKEGMNKMTLTNLILALGDKFYDMEKFRSPQTQLEVIKDRDLPGKVASAIENLEQFKELSSNATCPGLPADAPNCRAGL